MSTKYTDSYAKTVEALTEDAKTTIPGDGKLWDISSFTGNAGFSADTTVKLVWDYDGTPQILCITHGSIIQKSVGEITGDGVKKLAIVLVNDSNTPIDLGGSWEAWEF